MAKFRSKFTDARTSLEPRLPADFKLEEVRPQSRSIKAWLGDELLVQAEYRGGGDSLEDWMIFIIYSCTFPCLAVRGIRPGMINELVKIIAAGLLACRESGHVT